VNALRLLFGTLTILPVKPPTSVSRRTAGWAMTLAPLAGLVLAVIVGLPLGLIEEYGDVSPLLLAVLATGALALLTRGMHLDGLADVADGLGSGRRGEAALAIMKQSDIGPFGVVTLVLTLLLQVAALAVCIDAGVGWLALALALVWSRLSVTGLSLAVYPSARPDGLGSVVAGSVSRKQAGLALVSALVISAGLAAVASSIGTIARRTEWSDVFDWVAPAIWLLAVFVLALEFPRHAMRRFGGITGDVYGAAVEATYTAVLLAAALTA
jgi:adenosylcobinamide-GDP ribazoletransferase